MFENIDPITIYPLLVFKRAVLLIPNLLFTRMLPLFVSKFRFPVSIYDPTVTLPSIALIVQLSFLSFLADIVESLPVVSRYAFMPSSLLSRELTPLMTPLTLISKLKSYGTWANTS